MDRQVILQMNQIDKSFHGVKVLDHVSFDVRAGEIHALIGENGAGKSTLMKILGGVYTSDGGEIQLYNEKVSFKGPNDAIEHGIGIIYQEFNLIPGLSIAENIFLGKEESGPVGTMKRGNMEKKAQEVLSTLGMENIDTRQLVSTLSVANQQMVEISKVLFNESKIIVMDEPTAVLTNRETEALFQVMERLRQNGVSIIYISHRLEEIQRMCDRITVLRDGQRIQELDNSLRNVTKDTMVSLMVGRTLENYFPMHEPIRSPEVVLEVKNLTKKGMYRDISFQLHKGEILGLSGLVGAGRTEVAKAIFGAMPCDSGDVLVGGKKKKIRRVKDAITNQIVMLPEDRKKEGLVLGMSMGDNICLSNTDKVSRFGVFQHNKRVQFVNKCVKEMHIAPALPEKLARNFSGGNQQKGIIAKWIALTPEILILDEPTRGIDVGAKVEIYNLICDLTQKGISVLMISSEMMEIIGLCDRVLVMCDGRITGEFSKEEMDQEKILMAATKHAE